MTSQAERSAGEVLLRWAETHAGLVFAADRRAWAGRAALRAMARAGEVDAERYAERLRDDAAAGDELLSELTIGETYFFRDPGQLEVIRRAVLPSLPRDRAVRAWSAGCATGEEAYTLEILLREEERDAQVLGTDLCASRLAVARRGRYTRWSLRGVDDGRASRWFRRDGARYELDARVRESVRLRRLNLGDEADPSTAAETGGMDLVLCRNVLIYLDRDTVARVARRMLDSLSDDGWLFLGASDPPFTGLVPCEVVVTAAGLAYRRPRRAGNAVVSGAAAALATPTPRPPQQLPAAPPSVAPRRPAPERCAENAALTAAACYAARDYARAAELAAGEVEARGGDVERWIVLVRALANQGRLADAARACAVALERHRTAAELHYLHAVLLERARRPEQAEAAARRALYLDRSLGVAHLLLGGVLAAQGDRDGARRALAAAERTYAALDPAQVPPAADRETAGRLAGMARAGLRLLEAAP